MTPVVMQFVASHGSHGKTLEVGSKDCNGMLRNFFQDYIGVDMRSGYNVDAVAYGKALPFTNDIFDRVLYLETMEHDLSFWKTIPEMLRVLKPGGRFILSTRTIGFPKHEFPSDYYRFTTEAIYKLFDEFKLVNQKVFEDLEDGGVFGIAEKVLQ